MYVYDENAAKPESEAGTDQSFVDLAWTKLLESSTPNYHQAVVRMNDGDMTRGTADRTPDMIETSPWINSFHNQICSSIKAATKSSNPNTRYHQMRFASQRPRKRIVFKHGDCNVVQGNVAKLRRRHLQDIFSTLIDVRWRWTMFAFAMSFIGSWSLFAGIWWLIAYMHSDLPGMRPANATVIPCVTELKSAATVFLFSVETQFTIGYGVRYVTDQCSDAILTMCIQCILGVLIQAFMVGIVFAKLSRPKKRAQTLLFSRNAVICHRDGAPCLMFRVADMRRSHIIQAHVRAQIICKKVTKEGEVLPFHQQDLKIGADDAGDQLMFIWPTIIVHKIDRESPIYALSAEDMLEKRFEIVVILEGVVESTGTTTQARSSYLPNEILWGRCFERVITFRHDTAEYEANYELFNKTHEVDTPLCSAKHLDEIQTGFYPQNGIGRSYSACIVRRCPSTSSIDLNDESPESTDVIQFHTK